MSVGKYLFCVAAYSAFNAWYMFKMDKHWSALANALGVVGIAEFFIEGYLNKKVHARRLT